MNTWGITLAWVWGGKAIKARGSWFMYAAGTICIPYTVWVIAAAAYNIANTDYIIDLLKTSFAKDELNPLPQITV